MDLLGICHKEEACWRDIEEEASGVCLQACWLHELLCHILHKEPLHLHNKSLSLELSHKHRTESSSSFTKPFLYF